MMVEGGLLPSYNERVVYIYIERTFLDKKLSPSCGQGPRRITRGHFHYASSLPQPSWDGSGRANKAETPPPAERYFPYARAGKCVGSWSAIWTKGVVLGEFRKGEDARGEGFDCLIPRRCERSWDRADLACLSWIRSRG